MARGLLQGAILTLLVALCVNIFSTFSPMWLVVRTELEIKQCWYGEGIWTSRFWWGEDLPLAHFKCEDPKQIGPISTTTAYCDDDARVNKRDQVDYNSEMCTATNKGKIFSVLTLILSFLSILSLSIIGLRSGRNSKERLFGCRILTRREQKGITMLSLFFAISAAVSNMTTIVIMFGSPLFNSKHVAALSEMQHGFPYTGISSCSFQTPLHSVFSLLQSGPMDCIFPGPSAQCAILFFAPQALGIGFLGFLVRDFRKKEDAEENPPHLSYDDDQVTFRKVRHYSLYGASSRKFKHFSFIQRFCMLTFFPLFFMLFNASCWLAYLLLGIQVIVNSKTSIVDSNSLDAIEHKIVLPYNEKVLSFIENYLRYDASKKEFDIVTDVMNVFNFSPITSLQYFWTNGAYLIAFAVFVAVFIIPIFKVICWIWYFYAPADEIWRGRVLSALDVIGKYSLANLYVLAFLTIALTFDSQFIVIPLPNDKSFLVDIRAKINAGNGVGSYMFVLTSILSLLIGQFMIQVHSYASNWEEDHRANLGINLDSNGYLARVNSGNSYDVEDTPFESSTRTPLLFREPSSRQQQQQLPPPPPPTQTSTSSSQTATTTAHPPPVLTSTFRSLASFSSSADLSRMQKLSNNTNNSNSSTFSPPQQHEQPDVIRALASYGSRTALNVMAARERKSTQQATALLRSESIEEEEEGEEQEWEAIASPKDSKSSSKPAHPYVEAMCDRIHTPLQGVHLKWTPCGKIFVWLLIFIVAGFMLICQTWDLFEIHQKGFTGDIIIKPSQRYQLYSLISLTFSVAKTGYEVPAFELSTLFFLMTAVMPVLNTLGLAMMWTIPLTLRQQEFLFNWLEIASAWSSLDIFFVSNIAVLLELETITGKMIDDAVPNLAKLLQTFLPFEDGILSADMTLKEGFWILFLAVIMEKIAIYLITENAVAHISERRAENFLRSFIKQQQALKKKNSRQENENEDDGLNSGGIDTGLFFDATEGLLETDAMLAFAPAGRYSSIIFSKSIYGGIPRSWWVRIGARLGLLADFKTVTRYDLTGEWFSLDNGYQGNPGSIAVYQEEEDEDERESRRVHQLQKQAQERSNDNNNGIARKQSKNKNELKNVSWATLEEQQLQQQQQQQKKTTTQQEEDEEDSELIRSFSQKSFGGDDGPLSF